MSLKKYTVILGVYVCKYLHIEAENADEAETKAMESEENSFSLCHQCSDAHELDDPSGAVIRIECDDDD